MIQKTKKSQVENYTKDKIDKNYLDLTKMNHLLLNQALHRKIQKLYRILKNKKVDNKNN